jgi:mannose-6-phosphate isomerase-like protein (cupin superfamily)
MSGFAIAHLDEIDELSDGRQPWRPVRHHFGISSFGITAWTGHEVGDRILNEHDEADQSDRAEELYLVTQGRAVFELDGERRDAPAGTFVFVEPEVKRTAYAEEPETTIVAVGGVPGKAYEVSGWEIWAPFRPLYEAGDYAAVADRAEELTESGQRYAVPLYNLACCESLAGRTDEALEHLGQAIELMDGMREYAKGDSDLDAIRGEPRFEELVGG